MDITLNHQEITAAVTEYVDSQGISLDGKETAVDFTAGRQGTGWSATISITEPVPETTAKPKKVTRTRKIQPKMVSKNEGLNKLGLANIDPDAVMVTEEATHCI